MRQGPPAETLFLTLVLLPAHANLTHMCVTARRRKTCFSLYSCSRCPRTSRTCALRAAGGKTVSHISPAPGAPVPHAHVRYGRRRKNCFSHWCCPRRPRTSDTCASRPAGTPAEKLFPTFATAPGTPVLHAHGRHGRPARQRKNCFLPPSLVGGFAMLCNVLQWFPVH